MLKKRYLFPRSVNIIISHSQSVLFYSSSRKVAKSQRHSNNLQLSNRTLQTFPLCLLPCILVNFIVEQFNNLAIKTLSILNSQLSILNSQFSTLNFQLQTSNSKRPTPN